MIKIHEFFEGYASVPLSLRDMPVNLSKSEMTLKDCYKRLKELDEKDKHDIAVSVFIDEILELTEPIIKKFL